MNDELPKPGQRMEAEASFGDDPERIKILLPPGDPKEMLASVRTEPGLHLYGINAFYALPPDRLESIALMPRNTIIEAILPYCIHVPNDMPFAIDDGQRRADLLFTKKWAASTRGSSEADYRSPTHTLYHNNARIESPAFLNPSHVQSLPIESPVDVGPDPICTGTNIEGESDKKALYRYSSVTIRADLNYPSTAFANDIVEAHVVSDVVEHAVAWINRFIDAYRFTTGSRHVQRLPSVHIRNIFFRDYNAGVQGAAFGHGVRTAVMNRSGRELAALANILRSNDDIPLWDLLFLDARAALDDNQFTLAVVNAFQALELALQQSVEDRLASRGLPSQHVAKRLDDIWRTKDRLKILIPELTGKKLSIENSTLWEQFCWAYDKVRNEIIHQARSLDRAKTERAVAACEGVHRWLNSLS